MKKIPKGFGMRLDRGVPEYEDDDIVEAVMENMDPETNKLRETLCDGVMQDIFSLIHGMAYNVGYILGYMRAKKQAKESPEFKAVLKEMTMVMDSRAKAKATKAA